MMNNSQSNEQDDSLTKVVEPKFSKCIRYTFLIILFLGIVRLLYQAYTSYRANGVVFDNDPVYDSFFFSYYTAMTFIYMSLANLVQKKLKIILPPYLVLMIMLFIVIGTFLGQALGFFEIFFLWDKMLHTVSGMMLGLLMFAVVFALNESEADFKMGPLYAAVAAFLFSVAISGIWEFVEYGADWFFGTGMQCWWDDPTRYLTGRPEQGAGLIDTMEDMIVGAIGALIVSAVGYSRLKKGLPFMKSKRLKKQ